MFNFDWSELALIAVVALVLIGPKDMPVAIRAISEGIKKMRRMASELQGHVDEMVREADLGEARDTFRDLRGMNLRSKVLRTIDGDGTLAATLREKPLVDMNTLARPGSTRPSVKPGAAFIPPPVMTATSTTETTAPAEATPRAAAFIPPSVAKQASPPAPAAPEAE